MKTIRESDIEHYLVKRVTALGGECRKVTWIGRQGAPDRLVMLPSHPVTHAAARCLWVELKAPGGKAKFPNNAHERKQAREHSRMRAMGQRVEVVDSYEDVDGILDS